MAAYSSRTTDARSFDKPQGSSRLESLATRALATIGLRGDAGIRRPDPAARFDQTIDGVSEQVAVDVWADPLSHPQLEKMTMTQLADLPFDAARVIAPERSRMSSFPAVTGRTMWIEMALRMFRLWSCRHAQRIDLAEMEDHRLSDIGRSRAEVLRECSKWFWQK